MPTRAYTIADLDDARVCFDGAQAFMQGEDSDSEELAGLLLFAAGEPLVRQLKQEVGPDVLSLERLKVGFWEGSWTVAILRCAQQNESTAVECCDVD